MFRTSKAFLGIAYTTSFLFILLAIISPEITSTLAPWLVVFSVFFIGIPHGAIDHIMAAEIFETEFKFKQQAIFYSSYLLLMFILGGIWIMFPIAGMVIFLIISVYHFGQADIEDFVSVKHSTITFWYLARGSFIILLIIFSDSSVSFPILEQAMNLDTGILSAKLSGFLQAPYILLVIYLFLIIIGISTGYFSNNILFATDHLTLIALFYFTGPLIGFAVYFAVWHSAGHIFEMSGFLKNKGRKFNILLFYKMALPFTAVSIFGLFALLYLQNAFGVQEMFLTLMFILISVLTLPHMLIVHKMYSMQKS